VSDGDPAPGDGLGLAGTLTRAFIQSPLTPLLLLAAIAIGGLALMALSREEEPQISVPMIDILVEANGLKAVDVVELVSKPLEAIVKSIDGVEHVYSQTVDDRAAVTARFFVGTDTDDAILRVHEKIRANLDRIPLGIPEPLIVGRGINDVPIVVLTLSPKAGLPPEALARWDDNALYEIADELRHEIAKIDDVGLSFIVGGRPNQIRVEPDPERLSLYGVTLNQLVEKVRQGNRSFIAGSLRQADRNLPAVAGQSLQGVPDIGLLLITTRDGRPVYVKDVATIVAGGRPDEHQVWQFVKGADGALRRLPAVSLAIAKRKGANAVVIADRVVTQVAKARGRLAPAEVDVAVTRNYGETANDKVNELLFHLALATVSIVGLVTLAIGWREGAVVFIVIPTTILLTMFAAWLMGYTINRVSLFALIFSIGILVDDAIVVVENIDRHWMMGDGRGRVAAAIQAVAEVGNPTIVATLTVVAALLPMMFVSGLMGPYMSPIPANASAAMLFSFFVAVMVTPWLMVKLRGQAAAAGGGAHDAGRLGRFYRRVATPLLVGRRRARNFLIGVGGATLAACLLFYTQNVVVKLLPFDNKSELQVVVDLPEGSSLEATQRLLDAAVRQLADLPELTSIQSYAGTAAPFSFNGLVRHYYLRKKPEQGDLQINLLPKDKRDRASHDIALEARRRLADLPRPAGTSVLVVEAPPGPPVLATLLAEVYGPDAESRRAAAAILRQAYERVDFVVDVDDSFGVSGERVRLAIDQDNLEFHGVEESAVYDTIAALLGGVSVGYSQRGEGANPVEISVMLPKSARFPSERLLATPVAAPGPTGDAARVVELGDVVTLRREPASFPIFRHNGRFAEMVLAELGGRFEAPIYGMLAVGDVVAQQGRDGVWGTGGPPKFHLHGQPDDESHVSFLWDGEWEITYVTFRDMGGAFIAALLGIYLLVVAQFQSFKLPLLILVPVPLTLIGIMLGHWLFGAAFTATSMIGFIALAGIIVRNSILLVDFIRQGRRGEHTLRQVLIEAGAVRFKPILLTAIAAMIGAAFILADPIFQGLAISLLFGLASSTALTLLVIPAVYVVLRDDGQGFGKPAAAYPH
jgi:multidrug efflux pump subunit AcrB